MQDTARHDLRSPRHIPDAPCKVSRGVSTATVRYVIRSRMVNSLHDGALPVVVLFARHGPHIQPVAYQCANLEYVPSFVERRRRASRSSFLPSPLLLRSLLLRKRESEEMQPREYDRRFLEVRGSYRFDRSEAISKRDRPRVRPREPVRTGKIEVWHSGPQYLTHGSQSDYQIKVGRAEKRRRSCRHRCDSFCETGLARVCFFRDASATPTGRGRGERGERF